MGSLAWIATGLALALGAMLGFMLGRRGTRDALARLANAEQQARAQQAHSADAARAAEARAARDLAAARLAWQAEAEQAAAAQRAELDTLTRHLGEACDELDRLRTAAARAKAPPDTGQGFAATLPMGDI